MTQERLPEFFDRAPTLTVQDPLAAFLGAAQDGILTYRYADAVRLCGHSCPTVAGAYLMVIKGLKALYGEELPERGGIEAAMQGARDEGTVGVTASVVQLLTGAAPRNRLRRHRNTGTLRPPQPLILWCRRNQRHTDPAPQRQR